MADKRPRKPDRPPRVEGAVVHLSIEPFCATDLPTLRRQLPPKASHLPNSGSVRWLLKGLNDGVNNFLVQSRRERVSTADEVTRWNGKVERKARELLAALDVPIRINTLPPFADELTSHTVDALTSDEAYNASHRRNDLKLPAKFHEAVRHSIGAVWYIAYIANRAAAEHDLKKKRDRGARRKRSLDNLNAREQFLLNLGWVYQKMSKKTIPRNISIAVTPHPFVRFCQCAFRIVSSRASKFPHALEASDISALESLRNFKSSTIRTGITSRVYDQLNRERGE